MTAGYSYQSILFVPQASKFPKVKLYDIVHFIDVLFHLFILHLQGIISPVLFHPRFSFRGRDTFFLCV